MRNIGEQMDLPGVYGGADRRDEGENMVEPETLDVLEEEKIAPIIPESEEKVS